jgi:NADP-dependent 3-hydroxy acid dehydrogenase YdfG
MSNNEKTSCNPFPYSLAFCQVPVPTKELVSYNTYAPSKFAITALTEVLRHELTWEKNDKIRVSSLSPGEWKKRKAREREDIGTINQIDWQ